MAKDSITIEFRPTAADYKRVLLWYQWKRLAIILGAVMVLMFGFGLAVIKPTPTEPNKSLPLYFALFVSPVFIGFLMYRGIARQAKKIEAISDDTTFTFDRDGLEMQTALASAVVKWERFSKVIENSKYLVFFPQENIFYVVPKDSFRSKQELDVVKSILFERLGSKAKLKS